jgi:hypothetical protein
MKELITFTIKGMAMAGLIVSAAAFTFEPPEEYLGECWFDPMYQDWACGVGCIHCNCNWNSECPPPPPGGGG